MAQVNDARINCRGAVQFDTEKELQDGIARGAYEFWIVSSRENTMPRLVCQVGDQWHACIIELDKSTVEETLSGEVRTLRTRVQVLSSDECRAIFECSQAKDVPVPEADTPAVGEAWFVRIPNSAVLSRFKITYLGENVVALKLCDKLGDTSEARSKTYSLADVEFVKRVSDEL